MDHSVLVSLILITVIGAGCSKSIRIKCDEVIDDATDAGLETLTTDLPLTEELEEEAKLSPKRSVLVLMPTEEGIQEHGSEGKEEELRKCQKAKRCKTPARIGRVSIPITSSRTRQNPQRSRNTPKNPKLRLVSLKNSNAAKNMKNHPTNSEEIGNRAEKLALVEAIRKKLKSNGFNTEPTRKTLLQGTNVIDDDKYVCYCREKTTLPPKKETVWKPQWLTRKNNNQKKKDERIHLDGNRRQKPIHENGPRPTFLPAHLPPLYSDIPPYSSLPSREMAPIFQHPYQGVERLPYVPYVYHVNPASPGTILGEKPTRINIPVNTVDDSVVGQPMMQSKNKQMVGQPSPVSGVGSLRSPQKVSAISKTQEVENGLKNNGVDDYLVERKESSKESDKARGNSDYNLQAVRKEYSESTTEESVLEVASGSTSFDKADEVRESFGEGREVSVEDKKGLGVSTDNYVGDSRVEGEFETTGCGTLDYSQIKEVTGSYFTSKAYSHETGEGDVSNLGDYLSSIGPTEINRNNGKGNLGSTTNDPVENLKSIATQIAPGNFQSGMQNSDIVGTPKNSQSEMQNSNSVGTPENFQSEIQNSENVGIPENFQSEMQNSDTVGTPQNSQSEIQNSDNIDNPENFQSEIQNSENVDISENSQSEMQNSDNIGTTQNSQSEIQNSDNIDTPENFQSEIQNSDNVGTPQNSQSEIQNSDNIDNPENFQSEIQNSDNVGTPQNSQSEIQNSDIVGTPQNSQSEIQNSDIVGTPQNSQSEIQNSDNIDNPENFQSEIQNSYNVGTPQNFQLEIQNLDNTDTPENFQSEIQNSENVDISDNSQSEMQNSDNIGTTQNSDNIDTPENFQSEIQNSDNVGTPQNSQSEIQNSDIVGTPQNSQSENQNSDNIDNPENFQSEIQNSYNVGTPQNFQLEIQNLDNTDTPENFQSEIQNSYNTDTLENPQPEIQDSDNTDSETLDKSLNKGNTGVGKSNPYWRQAANTNTGLNEDSDYNAQNQEENQHEPSSIEEPTMSTLESLTPLSEATSTNIDSKNAPSNQESSASDYWANLPQTQNTAGPLTDNYSGENFETHKETENTLEKNEDDLLGVSAMIQPDDNYETMGMDLPNQDNEDQENEPSLVESTLKSSNIDETRNSLPFCDNTLLQKSIKAVINKFAAGDSSEMNEETVGSTGNDLAQEIVEIPNLRGIVSMPAIERTIIDKVKDVLTKLTGTARHSLDNDWATNVIRDNLRHMMAAAPVARTELPPNTVEERQFKDGKWISHLVTLEPTLSEDTTPSDFGKVQDSVKNLLLDPAMDPRAAKHPAVQNMIVESVRNSFRKDNQTDDDFDESVIQSTLDRELNLMEMEEAESTTNNAKEEELDVSNIDMEKLLDIAKEEAGVKDESSGSVTTNVPKESLSDTGNEESERGSVRKEKERIGSAHREDVSRKGEEVNSEEPLAKTSRKLQDSVDSSTTDPLSYDAGAAREPLPYTELSSREATTYATENRVAMQLPNKVDEKVGGQELESRTEEVSETVENKSFPETLSGIPEYQEEPLDAIKQDDSLISPARGFDGESTELVGITRDFSSSAESVLGAASPDDDLTYLGRISVKNNPVNDAGSLKDSDLYYVGDGVKLPLEIRKLSDGSYALSISRKVCEHLLNKECPCCVPTKGNVVRTMKRNSEKTRRKRISKRETVVFSEKRGDLADDGLQIFSMPVESFARRYNLSLNLEKLQTPWNFEVRNLKNMEGNADAGLVQDLLSIREILDTDKSKTSTAADGDENRRYRKPKKKSRKFENYRYQRNIDENVHKRMEIVKDVLNWLRKMILNTSAQR